MTFTDLNGDAQTITISSGSTGTQLVTIPSSLFEDVYKEAPAEVVIATDVTVAGGTDFEQLGTPTVGTITITDTPTDVTLTLNDVSVNEGSGTAQIEASLDHAPETKLTITLSNGATITFGTDYVPGEKVSSTPFDINNGEDVYVDNSSFDVFVKSTTGGNFENLVTTDTATVTVTDTTTPVTAELTVSNTAVNEGAADLVYTVTLKDAAGKLTPANNTVTVETTLGTITIEAGASSGTLTVPVQGDDVYVDGETLSNNITSVTEANAGTAGSFEQIDFDSTHIVSTTVSDTTDTTSISLTASPNLTEAGGDLIYTVTLDSPVRAGDDPVTVTFTDLNGDSQTITVNEGQSTGTATVTIPSSLFEDVYTEAPAEVVIATDVTVAGGTDFELLGTPTVGNITITDTPTDVTLTLNDVSVNEGSGTAQITASLDHAPETELVVTLSNGATLTFGTDYVVGTPVSSTPFDINNGEDVYVDNSSVVVSVTGTTGGNFEHLVTSDTATVTVTDTTTPVTAELTVDKTAISEGAADLVYTVTLKDAAGNLTPANNTVTVETTYGTVTIAQGASSGTLTVPVQGDDVYVDGETLSNNITSVTEANAGTAGSFEQIDFDSTHIVSTTVSDTTDTTGVSLTASPNLTEAGGDLTYTVTLDSPVRIGDDPVTVTFTDLNGDSQTITVESGSSTGTTTVTIPSELFEDVYTEAPAEVVIATDVTVAGGTDFELLGTPTVGNITITDTPTDVTLTLNDVSVNEGSGTAQITASLDHAPETELVVTLSNGATLTFGTDYVVGTPVSSTPFDINNGEDVYVDGSSFDVFVKSTTGGNFENLVTSDTATVTVTDTTTPVTAELTVDKTAISEGAADLVYTVTLKDAAGNLTPANNTVTVETTLGTITIEAGASSGTLTVPVQGDDVYVDGETLSNNITSVTETNGGTAGSFEDLGFKPDAVETVVSDTTDTTSVSLTASPDLTEAGGELTYTVTLGSEVRTGDEPVTVTFTDLNGVEQTITVAAGSDTGTVDVTIPPSLFEDVYTEAPAEVVIATDVTVAGGTDFEQLGTPTVGTMTITDTDTDVTLTLNDVSVNEGAGTAQITANLDHAPETELVVMLNNGATITFGPTYTPGDLVSSTPFDINNGEDVYLDESSFAVSVTGTTGGNFENLITTDTATVTVTDTTMPVTAELTVDKTAVSEGAADLIYTVTLKDAAGNLTPANNAVTVETTYGTIIIAQGASSGTLVKPVQGDDVYVDGETLSNNITSVTEANAGTAGSFEQIDFDSTHILSTTVSDTLTPVTVKLSVDKTAVSEGAADLVYTVTLTDTNGNPVIANNAVTVTTSFGDVIIAAGDSSATQAKVVQGDDVYKDDETVTNAITSVVEANAGTVNSFEQLGFDGTAVSTVVSDTIDPVYAQITVAQASVLEGGTLKYTVSLVDANGQPVEVAVGKTVDVQLNWSGAAANLGDVDSLPTSITIGASQSSATFDVVTKVDAVTEYSEPLTATISGLVDQGTVKFEDLRVGSANVANSNILDAPTITAVDDNGSAINGQITVYEKGLNAAADTSETASGVLRVTAPSGLDSISIAGTTITLAQLQGLAGAAQTITIAGHGTLTLTGMTANATSNGSEVSWDISYEYTLTDAQTHADAGGTNSLLKDIALGVTAKTADGTGVIGEVAGSLGVLVIDDVPQAANDTGTIVEDGANPLTGNVLTNDKLGADTQTNPVVEVGFGATSGTIGTALSGAYGQLTLNADGTYSYQLDNTNVTVNGLKDGDILTEEFTYTIKDADGDSSTATITITIDGKTDGVPTLVIADNNDLEVGDHSIAENATAPVTGNFTITAPDGLQQITVGTKVVSAAQLADLTANPVTISGAEGTLILTGFNVATGEVTYSYQQTGTNKNHSGGKNSVTDTFPIIVTDNGGDSTVSADLTILITDTVPAAEADTNSVPSGSYAAVTGNVISNDTQGADGAKVSQVQGKNAATIISPTGNTVVEGTYGNLTIHSDGTYSYQRNAGSEGGVDDVFTYTLRDGDGDTVNTTLTISIADHAPILDIPAAGGATTTVYESGLTGGTEQGSNKHTAIGTIDFTAKDGLTTVTLGGHTLTDVNQTFAGGLTARYEYNANGEGVIHYSYTLPEAVDSTTKTSQSFAITVTDNDGDAAPAGDLVINIINDAPLVVKDDGEVKEGYTLTKTAIEGLLANDTSGADGWVATGGVIGVQFASGTVQTVTAAGTIIEGTYGTLTLKSDGSYSYQAKPNVTTGPAVSDEFTYTVKDADGDTKETTLTIKVTDVSGALKDTQGTVYESGLADGTAPSDITSKITDQSLNLDSNWTVKELTTFTTPAGTFTVKTDGTYSYVLNNAVTENVVSTVEIFEFDVVDQYGNIAKNTVTIKIMDDAPLATADTATIAEDDALTVGGNVFTNDKLGADNANSAAPVTGIQFGTDVGVVGTGLEGAYGSLVLNADGTYTYTLDNDNAAVNALKTGKSLTEVFTYTITDADGDTATTTLTITINGKTDGDPTITPDDGNEGASTSLEQQGQATVYEKGLVETDNSQITTGTITLNTPDGLASIDVGGTLITLAQLQGLSPTTQITITTPQGIITVTGFTPGTTVGGVPTAATVAYSYELKEVQSTPETTSPVNPGLNNFDDIALIVTDAGGVTHSGSLQVNIIDDTPTANDDSVNVAADGFAANGNVVTNDRQGADTAKVTKVTTAGGADVVVPETGSATVVGVHGTLTIQADGTYTYQRANNVKSGSVDEFTYTLSDADGDIDTATLTVTVQDGTPTLAIPAVGDAGTTVYESGLTNGTSTDKTLKTTSGTIDFFTNDGMPSITLAGQTLTSVDTAITGADGLTARYEHDPTTGLGKIHYTYTLPETVIDTVGDTSKTFTVTVSDGDTTPDSAAGNLVIKVVNDAPLVSGTGTIPTIEVDETALATSNTGEFASAFTVNYGADGQAATGALVYSFEIDSVIATDMTDVATGKAIDLFMNGTSVEGRVTGTTDVAFTVSVDANGKVTLTQVRALEHPNTTNPDDAVSLPSGALSLKATVTDGDGDEASASISLGDKLSFKDDAPTITVDNTQLGRLEVDETNWAEDKVTATDATFINGVFDVNYGADGSAGTTYALTVTDAVNSGLLDTASGKAITLHKDGNNIVGKVTGTEDVAFTISIDANSGSVTLTQTRPIQHPITIDPDDAVTIKTDAIFVTATATDGDGDAVTSTAVDVGGRFTFKDDGPSIDAGSVTAGNVIDEKYLASGSAPGTDEQKRSVGSLGVKFGADKAGDVVFTEATITALNGQSIKSSGEAVTYALTDSHTITATANGKTVFTVKITNPQGTPGYELTLQGPLDHAVGADPVGIVLGFTNLVVTDRDGDSVTTSFNVLVKDDVPAAKAITVDEDSTALSTDKGNTFNTNADATQSNTSIDAGAMPAHGTATVNTNGTITYVPNGNYSGADIFTYTTMVNGVSKTFTVNVTVNPISDAPQLESNKTLVTPEDTSIALGLKTPVVTDKDDQNTTSTLGDDPELLGVITLSLSGTANAIGTLTNTAGDVTYTHTDGVYKFVITGVADLHLSGLTGDGAVNYVTKTEYEAIKALPAADRHENFTVKVSVDSYEVDGSGNKLASVPGANSSQTITVDVQAITDDIVLKVQQGVAQTDVVVAIPGTDKVADITFNEDTSFNLTSILAPDAFKDLDGSETRYLGLTGLPEGTIIAVDGNTFTVGTSSLGFPQAPNITIDGNSYVGMSIPGTQGALPNITITPPKDFSGDLSNINVILGALDADADSSGNSGFITPVWQTDSVTINLHVKPVAGDVVAGNVTTAEDTSVDFLKEVRVTDTDTTNGTEVIYSVAFEIPAGWVVTAPASGSDWSVSGTGTAADKYTITFTAGTEAEREAVLKGFTIKPPAHNSLDATINLDITTTDTNTTGTDIKTVTKPVKITVTPVAEKVGVDSDGANGTDLTINADHEYKTPGYEDEWFTLGIEGTFELDAAWTNEDSDEFTFAQFTPELVAGTGDVGQTDAQGSIFRYKDTGGNWHEFVYVGEPIRIPKEFLNSLEFKAVENFSGTFTIKVEAVTVDFDDDNEPEPTVTWDPNNPNAIFDLAAQQNASVIVSGSASLTNVEIRGVADDIALSLNGFARGKEDQPIDLDINALSSDKSEEITIVINDIPVGATITYINSDGTPGTFTAQIGNTTLELKDFNGAGAANQPRFPLTYQAPDNVSGNFTLNVTAQSEEKALNGDDSAVYTLPVNIFVEGVADDAEVNLNLGSDPVDNPKIPTFEEKTLDTDGGHIKLTDLVTSVTTPDTDGSEVVTVRISGLPEDFKLTGATLLQAGTGADRIWTVAKSNLGSVKIETPNNFSGEVTFQVAGVTTETGVAGGDSKTMSSTDVTFVVTPSPEAITTTSAVLVEDENDITSLNFDIVHQNGDTDETLGSVFVEKSQLDTAGFTLYIGETELSAAGLGSKTIDDKDYYILSAEQAKTLAAKGAEHKDGAIGSFDFKYEVTDGHYGAVVSGDPVTVVKDGNFTLTATPVTDTVYTVIYAISGTLGTTVSSNKYTDDDAEPDTVVLTAADTVTVNMKVTSLDNDGSEHVIRVLIEGVPVGVTVEGAEQIDGNTWVLIYEGAAAQSITAAGIDIPVIFIVGPKVSGQNSEAAAKIKMTVQSKDRGKDPDSNTATEQDSVNWHLKVDYPAGDGREPLVVNEWVYKDVGVSEDTPFELSDILSGTMAEETSVYPNTLTVTLSDVPEGTVIAGMTMTSQQMFDELGNSLGFKDVWTASTTVPAGSNGQAELDALLKSIEITSPLDKNDNNSQGEFTFNASLSTSVAGGDSQVSEIPKADMVIPVAPVTDEAIITVAASNVAEGSDSIPVTITVAKGVDGAFGEIVDGKAYVQVSNADGVLTLADGTALAIEEIDGENYYVVQVGKDGGTAGLKYTPNTGVILQPGDVTFTVKVTTQEQAPTGSTDIPAPVTTTESVTSTIEIVNNGVTVESTLVTGDEADSSGESNAIELTGAGGLKVDLIDTDGSEAINVIMLAGLPNGFLVYVGTSAGDATQATLTNNAGGDGTTNTWILSEGVLPGYVAILPPAYWSGTLKDLKLIVESGEVDLSDKLTESTAIANVVIDAKADGLVINPTRAFGKEGDVIALNLNAAMNDPDPATSTQPDDSTETTSLILTGLGEHAEFFIKGVHLDTSESTGRTVTYDVSNQSYTITGLSQDDLNALGFKQAKSALVDQDLDKSGLQIGVEAWTVESSNADSTKVTSEKATIDLNISNQLAGTGDDTLIWTGQAINGRGGEDTIQLRFGESLSGTQLSDQLKNIEVIDMQGSGANTITGLTVADVIGMTDSDNVLKIFGDSEDEITLGKEWTKVADGNDDDGNYTSYTGVNNTELKVYEVPTTMIE
ncbi:immunoglobulin-like domain-containing protein [Oceanisphaera ostreae]|uniref:Immunoglobulin-like domain-containing protein n=1 Tax=Oceanisphaera ostreae TaxID=914151 RepID=A0ABW3KF19_9GAMM